jgi:hypothetical protein
VAVLGVARAVGLPGRGWAWGFFWFSILTAIACPVVAIVYEFWPAFVGIGMVLAALWYYAAIKWVDQNSEWP